MKPKTMLPNDARYVIRIIPCDGHSYTYSMLYTYAAVRGKVSWYKEKNHRHEIEVIGVADEGDIIRYKVTVENGNIEFTPNETYRKISNTGT